jgi:DNA invertase Pin-like site-specific DNA recombinase
MRLGYARVSTDDQNLDHQRLREAGCERLFEEKVSGARRDRPELARLLDQLRREDVVVVTRLDPGPTHEIRRLNLDELTG